MPFSADAMRFLFCTLQFDESDFYGRVGRDLQRRGHEVAHVAYSRALRAQRLGGRCLPEVMARPGRRWTSRRRRARIERTYDAAVAARRLPHRLAAARAARSASASSARCATSSPWSAIFDEVRPDVLVPEVGSETMRTAAHLIAPAARRARPVRLLHDLPQPAAPVRGHDARRRSWRPRRCASCRSTSAPRSSASSPTSPPATGRSAATARRGPRCAPAATSRATSIVRATAGPRQRVPASRAATWPTTCARTRAPWRMRRYYRPVAGRSARSSTSRCTSTDDYKIKRVIPHCVDQAALIEQVADYLPQGHDVVHQGASAVDRAQLRSALHPPAHAPAQHPPGGAAHVLARADPALAGGGRDLLHGRAGGAAVRQAGADAWASRSTPATA